MDTSEYADKAERKLAKKITRHPAYQKIRERAVKAEAEIVNVQREAKRELRHKEEALEKAQTKIATLQAELELQTAPKLAEATA